MTNRNRVHQNIVVAWCLIGWLSLPTLAWASSDSPGDQASAVAPAGDALREQLTRHLGRRRPDTPWQTEITGRPLSVSGELSLDLAHTAQPLPGGRNRQRDYLATWGLEVEGFYSLSDSVSLFAQWRLANDRQLHAPGLPQRWKQHAERGEMWLHGRDIAGSGLDVQWGRIKFEEERRWWWDQELDALRLYHEGDEFGFSVAAAREQGRNRSDHRGIDAGQKGVRRWLASASWKWHPEQSVGIFVLRHDDRSVTEVVGQMVPVVAQDASDARLTWIGASLRGEVDLRPAEAIAYWFDLARLSGREHALQYSALAAPGPAQQSVVTGLSTNQLRGWAVDAGLRWQMPLPLRPRLSLAHATTFGGARGGAAGGFRQTGLQSNQDDFGAEKEFARYGAALAPELSNLRITTIGIGLSMPQSSSLDLVYHRYRQVHAATELRGARIDANLTGQQTGVGSALDLVATFHPSQRMEVTATASTFRAGSAFGSLAGRRYHYAALAMRVSF